VSVEGGRKPRLALPGLAAAAAAVAATSDSHYELLTVDRLGVNGALSVDAASLIRC